jgi:hypothetical protein
MLTFSELNMFKQLRKSKFLCALLVLLIVLPPELLAIKWAAVSGSYGALLFLGVPFSLGFVSVILYDKLAGQHTTGGISVALLATFLCGTFLLAAGWEGVVCMAIVFVIATPFSLLGAALAIALLSLRRNPTMAACLVFVLPVLAPTERNWYASPEHFRVETSIEIAAPPEKVWDHVVSFPWIREEPHSFFFRAGVAYPVATTIDVQALGATRTCIFTTGAAKETVDVWDKPHRLHFTVLSQPPLMREKSWVPDLKTEHIKSEYVRSREGQFDLIALPNGHTLLRGTSWYDLKYRPTSYWHLWTDAMVHRIHMRVLEHIKQEVERTSQPHRE